MSVLAFVISGALGAIAGLLVPPISLVQYDTGIALVIKGFVACIVGGLGRPGGAMLGGLVLGVAEAFAAGYLSSGYKNAIAFVLLLLFLRLRPSGLLGDPESEALGDAPALLLAAFCCRHRCDRSAQQRLSHQPRHHLAPACLAGHRPGASPGLHGPDLAGSCPASFAGNGYDSVMILAAAIKKAGADPKAIRDAIEQTKGYVGVTGIYSYSAVDHYGLEPRASFCRRSRTEHSSLRSNPTLLAASFRPCCRISSTGKSQRAQVMNADDIICALSLQPHPEGGHYRETFRDTREIAGRAAFTLGGYWLSALGHDAEAKHSARVLAAACERPTSIDPPPAVRQLSAT